MMKNGDDYILSRRFPAQQKVLDILKKKKGMTQTQISKKLNMNQSQVLSVCKRLMAKSLVSREKVEVPAMCGIKDVYQYHRI